MNKVTEAEKSLSENGNFEISVDNLLRRLADLANFSGALNGTSQKSFSDLMNDYVQAISDGHWSKVKLIDVNAIYVMNSGGEQSEASKKNFYFALVYAIAAQRARARGEVEASWSLLVKASDNLGSLSELNENCYRQKTKEQKSERASKNANVPRERFRYQLIGLLTREYYRPGWGSIDSALDCVKEDLISYIEKTKFIIKYPELSDAILEWIDEYPAFRAELKGFFVEGVIGD